MFKLELSIVFYLRFSVFANKSVVVVDDSPLVHLIDDMPLKRASANLIEFSVGDDDGDLINFSSDTTRAAIDLFGKLDLSQSFSWLYGSTTEIDVDGEKEPAISFGNLSPLKISGIDVAYECKRTFGHLDKIRRQLNFDDSDDD